MGQLKRITAVTAVLLFASNASAALLFEVRETTSHCPDCGANGIEFNLWRWSLPVTHSDIGKTFEMPTDVLRKFNAEATSPRAFGLGFAVESDGASEIRVVGYSLTNDDYSASDKVIRHAPIVGPNLTGYTITSVTQTINSIILEPIAGSDRYRLTGNASIHIYGVAVPEPATWVLVGIALFAAISNARKRCPRIL